MLHVFYLIIVVEWLKSNHSTAKIQAFAPPSNVNWVILGPLVVPFLTFFWREGSPTKMGCRTKGTLVLTSLLEDLEHIILR